MKSTLTLALCLLASRLAAQSGDSLSPPRHRQTTGFVEFGLLRNASLERLRDQLAPLGVTLAGTSFAPFGLQFYRRERRSDTEVRLWLLAGTGGNTASNLRLARLGGFGIGLAVVPRLVNTRRWVLGPVLGYDIVRYGLRIGAPTLTNPVPIQNVLANPLAHQSQVLRGTGITLNGGLAAGYRFNLFPKFYESWQFNFRLGYHLTVLNSQEWRFDQKTVSGLDVLRPDNLYLHVGLVTFPRFQRLRAGK